MPVEDLFQSPTDDRRVEHRLASSDLITGFHFTPATRSTYVKVMDRASWAFALVSAAIVMRDIDGGLQAGVVAGGVAIAPHRLWSIEDALVTGVDHAGFERAADDAIAEAQPLSRNGYKTELLRGALLNAYETIAG